MASSGDMPALVQDDEENSDMFTLVADTAWVTVENLSLYIVKTDEGVVVDIYPRGKECDDVITSTYAFFSEAVEPM